MPLLRISTSQLQAGAAPARFFFANVSPAESVEGPPQPQPEQSLPPQEVGRWLCPARAPWMGGGGRWLECWGRAHASGRAYLSETVPLLPLGLEC